MPNSGAVKNPYPNATDAPDVPGDLKKLADRGALMAGAGIGYAADATALAAMITNGDAFTGFTVYHAAADATVRYNGAAFKLLLPKTFADAAARSTWTGTYSGLLNTGSTGTDQDTMITFRWNGSAWKEWSSDWITWNTAPTNLTVGTGGSAATVQRYRWMSGRIFFDISYTLGTSGQSVGTNPQTNLPFAIALMGGVAGAMLTGDGVVYDAAPGAAVTNYTRPLQITTTTIYIRTYNGTLTAVSATAPITWAAGDKLTCSFWADAA